MEAKKVRLTKEKETYLATLYGKAMDAAVENPILGDRFAAESAAGNDPRMRRGGTGGAGR